MVEQTECVKYSFMFFSTKGCYSAIKVLMRKAFPEEKTVGTMLQRFYIFL